jgi:predicted dehydrogenase
MRVAFVGCGFVSALYLTTLKLRSELRLVGVTDLIRERRERVAAHAGVPAFDSVAELLEKSGAELVVNLTNPGSHYAVNRAALEAGKHVYCEKPLATDMAQAEELVALAERRGLRLSGAPCNVLGEVVQAIWRDLRRGCIGAPRLAYAELDDGMIHRAPYRRWTNELGIPWPWKDEFEVGCTQEHAGYQLAPLAMFFGPIAEITRFGAVTIPDKGAPLDVAAPDFTVACLRFRSGVTARITCSIVAPHDHQLRLIGEEGVLTLEDCWDYRASAYVQKWLAVRRRLLLTPWKQTVHLPDPPVAGIQRIGAARMDFARGVAELAQAIRFDRPSRLAPDFCLHVTEAILAIHQGLAQADTHVMKTQFAPLLPMTWAA